MMRIEILICLFLGTVLTAPAGAMPPRPGVKEPASLAAVKKIDPRFTVVDVNTSEGQSELLMKIESLGSTI